MYAQQLYTMIGVRRIMDEDEGNKVAEDISHRISNLAVDGNLRHHEGPLIRRLKVRCGCLLHSFRQYCPNEWRGEFGWVGDVVGPLSSLGDAGVFGRLRCAPG